MNKLYLDNASIRPWQGVIGDEDGTESVEEVLHSVEKMLEINLSEREREIAEEEDDNDDDDDMKRRRNLCCFCLFYSFALIVCMYVCMHVNLYVCMYVLF